MAESVEVTILRELLTGEAAFVSGSRLAERLAVSRVAVWSHMEKLRGAGFQFEAKPRQGYRIAKTPADLQPLFVQALLPSRWKAVPLLFHEHLDSTNSEAERQLAGGRSGPFVIMARSQSRGRGRLGRRWHSSDNGNLYLSFVFQPRLPPPRMQAFTLWMGATLCDSLNRELNAPVKVKWPNDLMLEDKKLGGMLTEARIDSDQIRDLVFGLGINANGRSDSLPPELAGIATSLAEALAREICPNRFTARLVDHVLTAYETFVTNPVGAELQQLWARYDFLAGKPVEAQQGRETIQGVARGIDADGSLLLEHSNGALARVSAGDVTLQRRV